MFPLQLLDLARRAGAAVKRLGLWRGTAAGELVIILILLGIMVRMQNHQTDTVYEHPATQQNVQILRIEGKTKLTTRTTERPGEKITERELTREPITTTVTEVRESAPVPLSIAMAPPRTDRWILALALDDFRFRDWRGYTPMGGYSFRNRVDVLAGYGYGGAKALVSWRF